MITPDNSMDRHCFLGLHANAPAFQLIVTVQELSLCIATQSSASITGYSEAVPLQMRCKHSPACCVGADATHAGVTVENAIELLTQLELSMFGVTVSTLEARKARQQEAFDKAIINPFFIS